MKRRTFCSSLVQLIGGAVAVDAAAQSVFPQGLPERRRGSRGEQEDGSASDGSIFPDGLPEPAPRPRRARAFRMEGCHFAASRGSPSDFLDIRNGSGAPTLDELMQQETDILASAFSVRPQFGFFDDEEYPNAMASPACLLGETASCWGTVLFGRNLLSTILTDLGETLGQNAIIGIMAHEYGHIAQFNYQVRSSWIRNTELHADVLAGWYVGAKHRFGVNMRPEGVFAQMYSVGDTNFTDPNHHGTHGERLRATVFGYQLGVNGAAIGYASQAARSELGF